MAKMVPDAFENYLVEVTALRIADECKSEGMLAAAMHARHKVRKADLEDFFTRANGCDADSWERKFYAYCLIVYAVAAYKDIGELCSAQRNCMGDVKVTPHWSREPKKKYTFSSVVYYEPLNLFPGLSTENMSGNMKIIDENKAAYYSDGTTKSMAMMAHAPREEPTRNQSVAERIVYLNNFQKASATPPTTPQKQSKVVKVASTPISKEMGGGNMAKNIAASQEIEKLTEQFDRAKNKKVYAERISKQVEKLRVDAEKLKTAGVSHYENLLKNYKAAMAGTTIKDVLNIESTLLSAQTKWDEYRSQLVEILKGFEAETKLEFPIK